MLSAILIYKNRFARYEVRMLCVRVCLVVRWCLICVSFLFCFYRFVVGGGPMSYFIMTRRSLDATLSLRVYQYCVNLFLN